MEQEVRKTSFDAAGRISAAAIRVKVKNRTLNLLPRVYQKLLLHHVSCI